VQRDIPAALRQILANLRSGQRASAWDKNWRGYSLITSDHRRIGYM